jgi:hypothetical protein
MYVVWNEARTVGVVFNFEDEIDNKQLVYEFRKGACNSLGMVTHDFIDAWAEMTVDDNCTTEVI